MSMVDLRTVASVVNHPVGHSTDSRDNFGDGDNFGDVVTKRAFLILAPEYIPCISISCLPEPTLRSRHDDPNDGGLAALAWQMEIGRQFGNLVSQPRTHLCTHIGP